MSYLNRRISSTLISFFHTFNSIKCFRFSYSNNFYKKNFSTKLIASSYTAVSEENHQLLIRRNHYFKFGGNTNNWKGKSDENKNERKHSRGWSMSLVSIIFAYCYNKKAMDERDFILACMVGNKDKIKELHESGVDINCRHVYGWTPLHTAAMNGMYDVVQWLIDHGADVDAQDTFSNIYQVARENGTRPVDVHVVREGEFSARLNHTQTFRGCTALHYAVLSDSMAIVQALLDAGADPTIKNEYDLPPAVYSKDHGMKHMMDQHIRSYIEKKTMREREERKNFPIEDRIRKKIIGQEGAIVTVCGAIRRKENGWHDEDHPLVFLFLGSSGIGKTELAKQIAQYLHPKDKNGFIRIDMSEYQQKHEVAKLIGAPPGYIGHDDGGQLTKRLKENPNAVVLFDEVEKAHPDVLTVLLQLFDEGRLTDGKGKTIECKDAIFIMTSNLASEQIADHALQLREADSELSQHRYSEKPNEQDVDIKEVVNISRRFKEVVIRPILKRHFQRDEFLGRINEIVYFVPFSRSELLKLVRIELEKWVSVAKKKHNIELVFDPSVLEVLADGYSVHYGARSIKYEVERRVVNPLALAFERELMKQKSSVLVTTVMPADAPQGKDSDIQIPIVIKVKIDNSEFVEIDPEKYLKK